MDNMDMQKVYMTGVTNKVFRLCDVPDMYITPEMIAIALENNSMDVFHIPLKLQTKEVILEQLAKLVQIRPYSTIAYHVQRLSHDILFDHDFLVELSKINTYIVPESMRATLKWL